MLAPIAALPSGLAPLVPADWQGAVAVAALCLDDEPPGVLLLGADDPAAFGPEHPPLIRALCEPLAVALRNDRQLRELRALREAAEADRRSLLQRLGRQDIADTIVGAGSGLAAVMRQVDLVAPADAPVLILGETGTGKEVVARRLHQLSGRGPFVAVNCAALVETLAESELFGHERGAFTGASQAHAGVFEQAAGGTLFLDEIGDMPLPLQAKLLRVLQERAVVRVGGRAPIAVDTRVVLATHQDLEGMVADGRFREDVLFRINVVELPLPPLRERRDDIPWLAHRFVADCGQRRGGRTLRLTPDAEAALRERDWPGNVRELRHCIERACIFADGEVLRPVDLFEPTLAAVEPAPSDESLDSYLASCERSYIEQRLQANDGRVQATADGLGISRKSLWQRMKRLGIKRS
jgi:transcriptional regulator with GAF, ATPase, and Fis domain